MRSNTVDGMRTCSRCKVAFPATPEYFHTRDGGARLVSYCKPCACSRAKRHHDKNLEKHRELAKKYREEHREELREYFRNYRIEHSEKKRQSDRSWRTRNAEHARAMARARYRRNKQSYITKARQWAELNPEKAMEHERRKRFRRRGAPPNQEAQHYMKILDSDPCCYCGRYSDSMEIDHIIPLSKGGDSHWTNLTAACRSCNASKSGHSLLTYLTRRKEA